MSSSLQELTCHKSSLFFLGCFKALEIIDAIHNNIDTIFGPYFTDPVTTWDGIDLILSALGASKMMANAGFSKDPDQGDGSKLPWTFAGAGQADIVKIYELMDISGCLIDDSLEVSVTATPTPEEAHNIQIWRQILKGYEGIKELFISLHTLLFSISEMSGVSGYDADDELDRSPQQLQLYSSYKCSTGLTADIRYGSCGGYALYPVQEETVAEHLPEVVEFIRHGDWKAGVLGEHLIAEALNTSVSPVFSIENIEFDISADDLDPALNPEKEKIILETALELLHPIYFLVLPDVVDDIPVPDCYGLNTDEVTSGTVICDQEAGNACPYYNDCKAPTWISQLAMKNSTVLKIDSVYYPLQQPRTIRMRYKKMTSIPA